MAGPFSIKQRIRSFRYAIAGIAHALEHQHNLRIHLTVTAGVIACGIWVGISAVEWAVLTVCIGMVFAAELFNSSLEELTDLVSPDHHPAAGRVKDMAAGAVLLSAIASVIAGLLILGPPLLARLI